MGAATDAVSAARLAYGRRAPPVLRADLSLRSPAAGAVTTSRTQQTATGAARFFDERAAGILGDTGAADARLLGVRAAVLLADTAAAARLLARAACARGHAHASSAIDAVAGTRHRHFRLVLLLLLFLL